MVARLLCDGSLRVLRARVGARPLGETLRFGRVLHSMPRDLRPPVTPRSEELGESTIAACPSIHVARSTSGSRRARCSGTFARLGGGWCAVLLPRTRSLRRVIALAELSRKREYEHLPVRRKPQWQRLSHRLPGQGHSLELDSRAVCGFGMNIGAAHGQGCHG
jgi:hypothetical protein